VRIIKKSTLLSAAIRYPSAEQALLAWHDEALRATWTTPNDLKQHYTTVSILTGKRVVFNIRGNSFRLIVDIEYRMQILFIVWFGSHKEYDKIDARTVKYSPTN
jgi:mRNA interferase HigB